MTAGHLLFPLVCCFHPFYSLLLDADPVLFAQVVQWLSDAHAVDVKVVDMFEQPSGIPDGGSNGTRSISGTTSTDAAAVLEETYAHRGKGRGSDAGRQAGGSDAGSHMSRSTSVAGSGPDAGSVPDGQWMVIATAKSQRHAYACGEAVRFQARDLLNAHWERAPLDGPPSATGLAPPRPQLIGGRGMDWVVVDIGHVTVHVLTADARKFYRLEALHSGA